MKDHWLVPPPFLLDAVRPSSSALSFAMVSPSEKVETHLTDSPDLSPCNLATNFIYSTTKVSFTHHSAYLSLGCCSQDKEGSGLTNLP